MTDSMSDVFRWLFISTLVMGCLAADDGDDFSNNLFSDLAPLLALFGERVTMQFMSQSMGWADNVILAMAPIGIITAIVASIRVGGPPWLKAVIGRARENLAVSEVELMSSTSKEVCEVWNGQEVVRCMGLAPVVEFICLLHYSNTEQSDSQIAPEIEVLSLKDAIKNGYIKDLNGDEQANTASMPEGDEEQTNLRPSSYPMTDFGGTPSGNKSPPHLEKICIIRDTSADSPNIILNCHPPANRVELWLFAVFATCLQLGVLAYSGLVTYHPVLKFQKDDKPVETYAYPCTAIGTLVLVLGMLLCGHVVESSTDEKTYEAVNGWKTRMVWLQQTKTVSDQVFNSCILYAKNYRQTITTSRRSGKHGKNRSTAIHTGSAPNEDDDPSTFLNVITMAGTGIALCGFVLQFVGLRGMHWSASVAQLGAVLVMVGIKAWVRRGLTISLDSEPLRSVFELDWFSRSLGNISTGGWSHHQNGHIANLGMTQNPITLYNKWVVLTGGSSYLYVYGGEVHSFEPRYGTIFSAQGTLNVRKSLARLAGWTGIAWAEAVSLARAMECTMNALDACLPGSPKSSIWELDTSYGLRGTTIHVQLSRGIGGWKVDASEIEAILSLWLSSVEDDESLQDDYDVPTARNISELQQPKNQDEWLRSEATIAKRSLRLLGESTPGLYRDLRWWVPKDFLRVFEIENYQVQGLHERRVMSRHRVVGYRGQSQESSRQRPHSLQNLNLAKSDPVSFDDNHNPKAGSDDDDEVPENGNGNNNDKHPGDDLSSESGKDYSSSEQEVKSPNSDDSRGSIGTVMLLGTESYHTLKALYAMDLFSSFTRAVSKAMASPIPGEAENIRTSADTDDSSWKVFTLQNKHLSKMIQDIHNTGLGSLDQIYLSVIPPLSLEEKLPKVDAVIDLALQRSKQNERSQKWKEAGDDLVWLFRLTRRSFPSCDNVVAKITANLVEYQRLIRLVLRIAMEHDFDPQNHGKLNVKDLKTLSTRLQRELEDADPGLKRLLWRKYKALNLTKHRYQSDYAGREAESLIKNGKGTSSEPRDILERTATHYVGLSTFSVTLHRYIQGQYDTNAQDLLGRTALHYVCLNDVAELQVVQWLINYGADLDITARDGATPLHYAVMRGNESKARLLVEVGARADIWDLAGRSPIHTAAFYGQVAMVEYLWDKAKHKTRDRWGRTVLHLAAMSGHDSVVKCLVQLSSEKDNKDRQGRTALHLAAMAGKESVATFLIDGGADTKATDSRGDDMFLLAVMAGRIDTVRLLINRGFDMQSKDIHGREPLATALKYGQKDVARLLMDHGINYGWKDSSKRNLLHYASMGPKNTTLIQDLLDRGFDINSKGYNDMSPLYEAVLKGRTSNVKFLLEKGADPNQTDTWGYTPLWNAIRFERVHLVQLLLKNGAFTGLSLMYPTSQTILSMVKEQGNQEIIDLVRRHEGMSTDDWEYSS